MLCMERFNRFAIGGVQLRWGLVGVVNDFYIVANM